MWKSSNSKESKYDLSDSDSTTDNKSSENWNIAQAERSIMRKNETYYSVKSILGGKFDKSDRRAKNKNIKYLNQDEFKSY